MRRIYNYPNGPRGKYKERYWKGSTIFTDSKSILTAVATPFIPGHSSYLILKIKSEIKKILETGNSVELIWIPSHKDIVGNETADQMAKEAKTGRDGTPTRNSIKRN